MSKFSLFQTVRVVSLHSPKAWPWPISSLPSPQIGDIGAIIGICPQRRESYTVESILPGGKTRWLIDFSPEDLEAVIFLGDAIPTANVADTHQNPVEV
jgi:hypothetical protein